MAVLKIELLLFSIPRQKLKKLLRTLTALVRTKWVTNGCLARAIKIIKRIKPKTVTHITATKYLKKLIENYVRFFST